MKPLLPISPTWGLNSVCVDQLWPSISLPQLFEYPKSFTRSLPDASRFARGVSLVSTDEFPDNSVLSAILLSGAPPEELLCQHPEPGRQCPLTGSPLSLPKVPPLFTVPANVKAASANTY